MSSPYLAHLMPSRHRRALIVPYATSAYMVPGQIVWESLVGPARGKIDIYGLLLTWGLLPESALCGHQELLLHTRPPTEARAARDAAARLRAWMNTEGTTYSKIALVAYGPLMRVWSRGIEGCRVADRVQLISVNRSPNARGLIASSVRRQVRDVVRG
jgi:hypothetical protein